MNALMTTLTRALTTKRAANTLSEAKFGAWLANRLPVTMIDEVGNLHVDLRTDPRHTTLFTSHTDTCARGTGEVNYIVEDKTEAGTLIWRAAGDVLGADDGAGVALMAHMVAAGVPGLYIFFRGEEIGGVGSSWLADNMPQALEGIERCISFDRAGYHDVITHQAGGRCCSDAFAQALAAALTTEDMTLAYAPDNTGVFTDSANLTGIVPECTNLSVGYFSQHGDKEWQNVTFLQALAEQLLKVEWDTLPTERSLLSKKAGHFKQPGAYDFPDAFYDNPNEAEMLADALHEALGGRHGALEYAIADYLMPDDPESALHHVDVRRMKHDTLRKYMDGLDNDTYDYEMVLDTLAQDCVIC